MFSGGQSPFHTPAPRYGSAESKKNQFGRIFRPDSTLPDVRPALRGVADPAGKELLPPPRQRLYSLSATRGNVALSDQRCRHEGLSDGELRVLRQPISSGDLPFGVVAIGAGPWRPLSHVEISPHGQGREVPNGAESNGFIGAGPTPVATAPDYSRRKRL